MAHAPHDERLQIVTEREQQCEQIARVLRTMKDRIERKDELLQGYERDLAKLRLAEDLLYIFWTIIGAYLRQGALYLCPLLYKEQF